MGLLWFIVTYQTILYQVKVNDETSKYNIDSEAKGTKQNISAISLYGIEKIIP